ncbi:MAG: hypothetical protein NT157_03975 [Candidatus Micrarchaeota archaeon]|nr:hypothetical protein [Candidatus Micrarchaeota archaeon]
MLGGDPRLRRRSKYLGGDEVSTALAGSRGGERGLVSGRGSKELLQGKPIAEVVAGSAFENLKAVREKKVGDWGDYRKQLGEFYAREADWFHPAVLESNVESLLKATENLTRKLDAPESRADHASVNSTLADRLSELLKVLDAYSKACMDLCGKLNAEGNPKAAGVLEFDAHVLRLQADTFAKLADAKEKCLASPDEVEGLRIKVRVIHERMDSELAMASKLGDWNVRFIRFKTLGEWNPSNIFEKVASRLEAEAMDIANKIISSKPSESLGHLELFRTKVDELGSAVDETFPSFKDPERAGKMRLLSRKLSELSEEATRQMFVRGAEMGMGRSVGAP